jgi:hypothetical protein
LIHATAAAQSLRVLGTLLLFASVSRGVCQAEPPAEKREIWVISGQSNACGSGDLPGPAANARLRAFDFDKKTWVAATDPLPGLIGGRVGPWIYAANLVAEKTGSAIDLTALGIGGHVIGFWAPKEWLGKGLAERIDASARGGDVFLFYQGESDSGQTPEYYRQALQDLVSRVRRQTGNPTMTAVIIQIAACDGANAEGVREGQRQFVAADANAVLVPALGRSMRDGCHLNRDGYASLGQEIGRALLRHRHKSTDGGWPGPVMDKVALDQDGRAITAHFAEVSQLRGADAADFVVVSGERRTPCRLVETGRTLVKLAVDEPIALPARLVYGGRPFPASSLVDESGNRAPAVTAKIEQGNAPADQDSTAPNGAG